MRKTLLKKSTFFLLILLMHGISDAQKFRTEDHSIKNIIYFNPEIAPDVEEIKAATYLAFFSTVTDRFSTLKNAQMLRVEAPISYEHVDPKEIREFCLYNEAEYAVVPKVKFFKVGLGKFVFSSQVVVSMKLFDNQGELLAISSYDTYRKNARILGSAENSIKIGTDGALKKLIKKNKYIKKKQHL